MADNTEQVVLVADDGTPVGVADKLTVHTQSTPLHLAFSCHVFNSRGQTLVTRRALGKATWPGVWTNSFCGHPSPGEEIADAVARRARLELGITVSGLSLVLPDFRYRAVDASGIVENEICPVYRAETDDEVRANPDEVAEWQWVDPISLKDAASNAPFAFSPWLVWQLEQLHA
ncbi:isopentenyl-diphosphate Delta-isomerase [Galbitalea soli]|uniref:Isopentenyl-diphosphate Delta-isomerase n=1 Tax=Galbitalea soli TaxID=1268042 RepID=A0A7C9TT35_9MICO|nr:isopentenyl-diphosphate Delta-isomerase [Galbitalea soli]NEM91863.1 isopentenyl-diphosphate Delta-isomerase [Galbitalea soli]NYJ29301.1 isopentenyl-diphosphate delta-isomerase [Galbitalea soli]